MRLHLILALALLPGLSPGQTATPPATPANAHPANTAQQTSADRLAQTNRDLLDLLKKQQGVLEDIQYDRRLQSRQIQSLEERLQETLIENSQLQNKIDKLSAAAAQPAQPSTPATPQVNKVDGASDQPKVTSVPRTPTPPPPPASTIPDPEPSGPPGAPSWHRVMTIAGNDSRSTDIIAIQGRQWRVFWHNQDKDGPAFKNTSALFLNAFPKDDVIPQKVCAKLGTGGGSTQLIGPGNYYIKIEASGGSWELAVEDFH